VQASAGQSQSEGCTPARTITGLICQTRPGGKHVCTRKPDPVREPGDTLKPGSCWAIQPRHVEQSHRPVILEDKTSQVGRAAMNEIVEEAIKLLALSPVEAKRPLPRRKRHAGIWCVGRKKYLSWARTTSRTTWARHSFRPSSRRIKPVCVTGGLIVTIRAHSCPSTACLSSTVRTLPLKGTASPRNTILKRRCSPARHYMARMSSRRPVPARAHGAGGSAIGNHG